MSKIIRPLAELQVRNAKPREKDYKLFDGGGLYLEVKAIPPTRHLITHGFKRGTNFVKIILVRPRRWCANRIVERSA